MPNRLRTARFATLAVLLCLGALGGIVTPAAGGPAPPSQESSEALNGGWQVLAGGDTRPGQFQFPQGVAVDGEGGV